MWLETLPYNGEKCSPTQPLQWPRKIDAAGRCSAVACTELPPHLIQAACELALALHKDKTSLIGSGGGGTEEFKRVQVGSLSVEYFDPHASSGTTASKNTGPLLFQRFPWLVDLLSCFTAVKTGGKGVIARVRS